MRQLCEYAGERASHPNGCHSYRKRASTWRSADRSRAATGVAKKATEQPFGGLQVLMVGVRQARALRVEAPPALEAPEALLADPQARDAAVRAAWLAGLEVKEALEQRRRPAAVGLALTAVEKDNAWCPGANLVDGTRRS